MSRRGRREALSALQDMPVRVNGVWVEPSGRALHERITGAEPRAEEDAFSTDLYEYMVAHEIVSMTGRFYAVCTREPAAREALRRGLLPADFKCPARREDCPMRRILAPGGGQSLRFERAQDP